MQYYKSKWANRTWYAYRESPNLVNQLSTPKGLYQTITQTLDQVTVWLQVYYMHLCCAHVLPWSVCARSAQHQAPAASHTGAGHKGGNPYTPPHQNRLGEVQPSHSHNKGPKLPMSAIPIIAEYRYMKNPKGKKLLRYEQQKTKKIKPVR